jgi:formylglycine-generating enzyme required for sulfatase activity
MSSFFVSDEDGRARQRRFAGDVDGGFGCALVGRLATASAHPHDRRVRNVRPSSCGVAVLAVLVGGVGCRRENAPPSPTSSVGAAVSSVGALSSAPPSTKPASSSEPGSASAPCSGKAAGARACSGSELVECDGSGSSRVVQTCFDIERCDEASGTCAPACGAGEVYVPATPKDGFRMGRGKVAFGFGPRASGNTGDGLADTPHSVVLTRPFCMDALEITVAEYDRCVQAGKCSLPGIKTTWRVYPHRPEMPANMIDWKQAKAYCEFEDGKTLPTEAQWEWAAAGPDGRRWPWGDETPSCEHADFTPGVLTSPAGDDGCQGGGASIGGSHPKGDKAWPSGTLHDLAGNVWEWTLDNYWRFDATPANDPVFATNLEAPHVVKGGGWNRSASAIEAAFRGSAVVDYQRPALGGRCVRNPKGTVFQRRPTGRAVPSEDPYARG